MWAQWMDRISLAWILCALREQYNHCDKLEQESGSDNSPNSLKKQLEIFLGTRATRELLVDKIAEKGVGEALEPDSPRKANSIYLPAKEVLSIE